MISIALIVLSILQSIPTVNNLPNTSTMDSDHLSSSLGETCNAHSECSNEFPFCYDGVCDICDECHYCHDGIDDSCGSCGDGYPLYEDFDCLSTVNAPATSDEWNHECSMILIHYISPFRIDGDYAVGCPWRSRNTIFRSISASFLLIASTLALLQLFC